MSPWPYRADLAYYFMQHVNYRDCSERKIDHYHSDVIRR
jgi:hypothetical protein